jgi:phosphohistidine phosphatase
MAVKTLYFLRHSKALAAEANTDDHARMLSERGERDASMMGEYLLAQGVHPQLVLCSPSTRTRQTFQLMQAAMERPLNVQYESKLYLASPKEVLDIVAGVEPSVRSLMVLAHNPTLQQLAYDLTETGDEKLKSELAQNFPTTALAELQFSAEEWAEIAPRSGTLKRFVMPSEFETA